MVAEGKDLPGSIPASNYFGPRPRPPTLRPRFTSIRKEDRLSEITEMTSMVMQGPEGDIGLWRYRPLDELGLKEGDLESAIVAQPKALIIDPLELLVGEMAVYSQPVLSFRGSVRKPDVVIVTDHGDVVVVEVKRLVNAELRDGRQAIAQGVEYASLLSSVSEADLVRSLTKGKHSSWNLLCRHDLGHGAASRLANVLRNRIRDGDVHLVIACEEAPPELADLVRAAANSSRLAFALHVVEVRPMVPDGASEAAVHPIAWVPWPRLDTEIVHRTAVTVRVEGSEGDQAPKVVLDVQDDSASEVEERIANSSRSARRRERELILQRVLSPLAGDLDLTSEQLLGRDRRTASGSGT